MDIVKSCVDCGENKPLIDFYKNKNTKDGCSYYCKVCHKKRSSTYTPSEKSRERARAYQKKHYTETKRRLEELEYIRARLHPETRNSISPNTISAN